MTTNQDSKKADLKKPDAITEELQKGFVWSTKHATALLMLFVAFLVIGGGYTAYNHIEQKNEAEVQEKYFVVEKKLNDKLAKFLTPAEQGGLKRSGDLAQDFQGVDQELKEFINAHSKSKAGKMAALSLAKLYVDYGKNQEALEAVSGLAPGKSLLDVLVANQKASLLANLGKCEEAVGVWEQAKTSKEAGFAKDSMSLKQAVCYEQLGQKDKALGLYAEIQKNQAESAIAKSAKRYEVNLKGSTQ